MLIILSHPIHEHGMSLQSFRLFLNLLRMFHGSRHRGFTCVLLNLSLIIFFIVLIMELF